MTDDITEILTETHGALSELVTVLQYKFGLNPGVIEVFMLEISIRCLRSFAPMELDEFVEGYLKCLQTDDSSALAELREQLLSIVRLNTH